MQNIKHCTVKNLKNLIEQADRYIKRRFVKSVGFQNPRYTSLTIKGIEIIHTLYKRNHSLQRNCGFSTYKEL
ncbi:TPA: IS6 family transposase [Bacillus cereus]|nr:IS6 family transposase [Bacillus cereus]HDR3914626.1 IS6 family transposase [Bacillus cereus]HDV7172698.1 IS6 family transposase [Bacillus cereus]